MAEKNCSGVIHTVLTSNITENDQSVTVASSSGFPLLDAGDWFWARILRLEDGIDELVKVTGITDVSWDIERAPTAYAFNTGDTITLCKGDAGKIGVLGASEIVFPWFDTWSALAQRAFDAEGVDVDIRHTGSGALSHFTALNSTDPETGKSYVEITNSMNPDIIVVELGITDAILNIDNRSGSQLIGDAQALYAALRAGSPDAVIIYSRQIPYDEVQHGAKSESEMKKKYCIPHLHSTSTMPGETGLYTSEATELEKIIEPMMQDRLRDWRALDAECQNLADVVVHTDYFRPARLGLLSHDRLHLSSLGHFFFLSDMWKILKSDATLASRIPQLDNIRNLGNFTDLSITWKSAVKPDAVGDGYLIDPEWLDGFEYPMWLNIRDYAHVASYPEYWGNQQRPSISISDRVVRKNGEVFVVMISNAWPSQPVSSKLWPAHNDEPSSFDQYTPAKTSSGTGDMLEAYSPPSGIIPPGDYFIKYKIGTDVFGPFPIAIFDSYPWE
ncbi:hypothetical protein A3194_07590 [Candidatus Thiodiazotropha endoloripes]|uniref:SGNH/GDSL hydrolase family protein n=1 Tax=Candidatus Thiodiazotropha endoloripes TaxID=1818881 RepID=UPI00083E4060|nr:SGNH/GDSL hydrolase family protein [Candidatus Thiodiazotropha endoloripes]ODB92253.1 hypothetical protein A3194_07590 [Candidatus Thiodiazotropha endoloripes]